MDNKKYIAALSCGHFATDINSGSLPAMLPFFVSEYGMSYTDVAGLMFASSFLSSLIQPLFGLMADRGSRQYFMGAGILLAAIPMALTGVFSSYWAIFACVTAMGIGSAVFHPEAARNIHALAGRDQAKALSIFSMGGNGGFGSVEADSWVVIALSSLKRDADTDPDFVKNGNSLLADLLRYRDEKTGGFRHLMSGGVDEMVKLYVRFNEEAKENEALNDEGRAWFKKIEDGDPEALEIFNWFKSVTLKDAERVYEMLGVTFDSYAGESFYNDKMEPVIEALREKGLLKEDAGAQIVDLTDYGMPPALILRSDGATLYMTRDLAAAKYRKDTYDFDKSLYVVAYQQDLHFRQLFKVLELMGYDWAKQCEHVAFGMVSFEGGALSTREGHVVYLDDLLHQAIDKARAIIDEKSPDLENKDEVARQVGIGAVVFFDLYNNRIKDIDFTWERALNFDGETGPYVQYTHARSCSVLRKAEGVDTANPDFAALSDPFSQDVVRLIEQFPDILKSAVNRSEPSMVTRFCVDLAQAFNKFYYENKVMVDEPGTRAARLLLTRAVKQVLRQALYLIGVEAPERM